MAQDRPAWMPTFAPDGTVHVPAFDLPPSALASPQANDLQKARAAGRLRPPNTMGSTDITVARQAMEDFVAARLKRTRELYPSDVVERRIAGVRTRVITPKGGKVDTGRVLINVHGGAFYACAEGCALIESLPIAWLGRFTVITVDYRQAPEHVFPAASEDVAAVYRELLKTYKPRQIGIYGCSAGGALTAQMAAWLPAHGLPQAGAVGIFGSGGIRSVPGDSVHIAARTDGSVGPPGPPGSRLIPTPFRDYFEGTPADHPMVSPALHPAVLAKFPPSLLITGTRAFDMSPAIVTHSRLLDAGVDSNLIVGEAMDHCYFYDPDLPESRSAYRAIVNFFRKHLG
jgi:epsilon-lactone hydrolase